LPHRAGEVPLAEVPQDVRDVARAQSLDDVERVRKRASSRQAPDRFNENVEALLVHLFEATGRGSPTAGRRGDR
jgi:hypothetical protein